MELKPGYKQTTVGALPKDWTLNAVADLVEPTSPVCYGVVQVGKYVEDGIPIVAIKHVKEISHAPLHRTAKALEQPYARSRVRPDDVLVSIKGTIGRVGIVPAGFEGNISRELARLRIKDYISSNYVAHQFEAEFTQQRIMRAVVGTTRLEFSIAALRQFELPIPAKKAEQKAIAEALSDADALIESLDQLIAKKRQIKQGAMQELLTGKRRLPGFEGEWVIKRLGDVAEISKGQLITESTAIPGDVPVIAGGKKPAYFHNRANRTGKTITISGSGASAGYVAFYESPIFASDCSTIGEGGSYSVEFIYYVLVLNQEVIYKAQTGGAQPHIHPDDLRPLMIHVPIDYSEQAAIATILCDVDAELVALESRLAKARQIKQGMMQELLTGRIRLL